MFSVCRESEGGGGGSEWVWRRWERWARNGMSTIITNPTRRKGRVTPA